MNCFSTIHQQTKPFRALDDVIIHWLNYYVLISCFLPIIEKHQYRACSHAGSLRRCHSDGRPGWVVLG